jgi:radial spoke head protein 4/6
VWLLTVQKGESSQQEAEEDPNSPLPNLMEQCYYFEQAGVGLSREEMLRVWLAMKSFVETQPVESIRLWGKILGTQLNYIIIEVEFREGEGEEEETEVVLFYPRYFMQMN